MRKNVGKFRGVKVFGAIKKIKRKEKKKKLTTLFGVVKEMTI